MTVSVGGVSVLCYPGRCGTLNTVHEPIVDLLAKQSRSRLKEMELQIQEQIEGLQAQGRLIKRALAEQDQGAAKDRSERPSPETMRRRRGPLREAITEIVRGDVTRIWLPSDVRAALAERGVNADLEAVRVSLRRMGEAGELARPSDGGNGWRVVVQTNGPTTPPTQSSWEPGGSSS